jgi:four helix bundle protein
MVLDKFRSFQLSVDFHRKCASSRFPGYLRNQILRASSSISLNLGEGSSKPTVRDRLKYYHTALGSLRECQSALMLIGHPDPELVQLADKLGAHLYRLCHPKVEQ